MAAPSGSSTKMAATSGSSSESDSESESEESDSELRAVSEPPEQPSEVPGDNGQEGSPSPAASAGHQWSLRSIMNNPAGTPVSSIFENTPARSGGKLSPRDFPSSLDPADPSSAEPADLDPNDDDMSIEELVSQVAPMEMSDASSSSSEDEPQNEPDEPRDEPDEPPVPSSVRSTTGGKRPRPRLSALSESDGEKVEQCRARPAPGPTRRPGRPRVKQKAPSPPPPGLSDSESEDEVPVKRPSPRTAVPSKGSQKAVDATPPVKRGPGRPRKSEVAKREPVPRSREVLTTASESSDDGEVPVVSRRRAAPPPVASSDEEDRSPPSPALAKPEQPVSSGGDSSDSDSPPKLDGVSTSDANKKATFSRLFFSRLNKKRNTSRAGGSSGPPATSSERSDASPAQLPPPPPPPLATPTPVEAPPVVMPTLAPAVPLPPLSRQNGVPVLRCRIEKRLLPQPGPASEREETAQQRTPGAREDRRTGAARDEGSTRTGSAREDGSRTGREEAAQQRTGAREGGEDTVGRQRREGSASREGWRPPSARSETSSSGQKRRRRTSEQRSRKGKRDDNSAASSKARRPGSVLSHSSCSNLATDDVTDDVTQTPQSKRRRGAEPGRRSKTPTSQPSQSDLRIESPPTGVREADSSTNPSVQQYDSNVPVALYTNQPFPIPGGDQHQYLKQAKRLKRAADQEQDLTLQVIRYTQAVLYFLLTALSMEKDSDESDGVLTMLNDTLKLIKHMLHYSKATYRKQNKHPSHIDHKLQTLLLRCQGLIYLRMFKLKEDEHKKAQRQIADFRTQMLSDSLSSDGRSYLIPREMFRLVLKCNETQAHLRDWLECWQQADAQMAAPGTPDTGEFFADMDRTMGGLPATSNLLNLVYYIRETTRRLQKMHSRAGV